MEDEINKIKSLLASLNLLSTSANSAKKLIQLFPNSSIYLPELTITYLKNGDSLKLSAQHIVPVICNLSDIYRRALSGLIKCE